MKRLNGLEIERIEGLEKYSDEVHIFTRCGRNFLFYHEQDCCENVQLEDFEGGSDDMRGASIFRVEETLGESLDDGYGTSSWTFYTIKTSKGDIWMRWLGESNGYYSESVDFKEIE